MVMDLKPLDEAQLKIENAGHPAYDQPFRTAEEMHNWYVQVCKDIGPTEIWWAIISEHMDTHNANVKGDTARWTHEQAAANLMWRASCEWDV